MNAILRLAFPAVLLAFTAALLPMGLSAHPSIDVVASNWKFTPNTVTVPAGQPATLRLTSSGGVHGLKSDELGIPETTIMPNRFTTVTFTPKKAGTYVLHCSIVCGVGHSDMTLTVKVQ